MRQLPKAKTKDEVNFIFEQLQILDEEKINGKQFLFYLNLYYLFTVYLLINY